MLRSTLLYLSRQPQLRRWMETSTTAAPLTRRFVAGQTLDRAIGVCRRVNTEGIDVSLDHLGENVTSADEARHSLDEALQAIREIADQRLRATVSIKLTQFGLDLSGELCHDNVDRLVGAAKAAGTRVEFDMESSGYVDRTLEIVEEMHRRHRCVRAVVQAYLHRSLADVRRLCAAGIPVRLCKGAYQEAASVAFQEKARVDENYLLLGRVLLDDGPDPAFATHDDRMVAVAQGVVPEKFEYQMLYGVRRDLQRKLVFEGYRLRLYLPYGEAWYPYFMRRLAERPANVWFVMRSLWQ
jgi:proline dehydrogenase